MSELLYSHNHLTCKARKLFNVQRKYPHAVFILSLSPEHNVYLFHRGSTLCLHIFFCYVIPVEPWTDSSILSLSLWLKLPEIDPHGYSQFNIYYFINEY